MHVGFQFSYDLGDEPDEDDDEINNTDGEEGEEEQDDILIVEGEDECIDDDDDVDESAGGSPALRGKSASNYHREIYNCSSAENAKEANHRKGGAKNIGGGLTPANINNKSLNTSQEEVSTQLYGGDIYLLGGSHFLMKDQVNGSNENTANHDEMINGDGQHHGSHAAKFSQASTNTGSELPYKSGSLNR